MKNGRSSQAAILVLNWVKQFFPVSIVNKIEAQAKNGFLIKKCVA